MDIIRSNILTIITFTPAVGALLLLFHKREHVRSIRWFALIITILAFVFSLHLAAYFDASDPDFQFAHSQSWRRGRFGSGSKSISYSCCCSRRA